MRLSRPRISSYTSIVLAVILSSGVIGSAQETKKAIRQGDMPVTVDLRHLERCWRADMRVAAKKAGADSDPFKPIFHVMPAAGSCGDPNGPIYANGKYHLFFQHAPELVWGKPVEQWEEYEGVYSHTGWGRASSRDLVYWEHEPIALMPEKGSCDPNLCASGSAVVADDGTAMIFYTAAEPQRQCIARSVDPNLRWWRKDPANPIISEPAVPGFIRGGFRDPYLWREGDAWHMIVGGGIRNVGGTALHFRSTNLTDWTYTEPLAAGMGEHCIAWECPNFLPLEGGKALLFVSPLFDNLTTDSAPRGDVVYTIASYQGDGKFQPGAWNRMDMGGPNNFYATQALKTPDGRWLLWGMNLGGGSPGHDWTTHLSLPRVLTLRSDGLLGQEPPAELQKLRRAHWGETDKALEGEHPLGVKSNTFEIVAEIEVGDAKAVGMDLRASDDFQTSSRIWLDVENSELHADGYSSDFKLLEDEQDLLLLHAFVDRSVIEVFINRRRCATIRAFRDIEAKAMRLFSQDGAARIRSVDVWEMGSIWEPAVNSPASTPPEAKAAPARPGGFQYFVGIVGNPSVPDIRWDDEQLEQIKSLGVNTIQLSIAWGHKPADEVLNLEDLDADQREKFAFRIKQAKKHGLRMMAHFGIPRMIDGRPACVLDPAVQEKYRALLTEFMRSFPDVDDVMVYTFDQGAWLCSEFGPCPRCTGVPLDERVPGFLDLLNETMQECRPNTRLWWKPWELSKGQVMAILAKTKPEHFGLVLNPSTSNEVYPFNDRSFRSDLGVKRLVQIAFERSIPVLGEFDHTLYKPLYQIEDFFPRLVYEQMMGWKEMEGVVGVKEYCGFAPSTFSVNAAMLRAWMKSPDAPLDTLLERIAAPYGPQAAPHLLQAWEYVARSVEVFPWDTTYMIGPMGLDRGRDGSHGWEPAAILNATWDTPIWKANRRANFMLTEEDKAHPWLFEDAGLRLEDCAALSLKAVAAYDRAIAAGGPMIDDIRVQRDVVWKTARSVRAKSLHLLETLAAQDARTVQADEKQFALVVRRLESLLKKDVENQGGRAAMARKLEEFQRDPKAWLNENLNPSLGERPPKGYEAFSNATMDWDVWVPPRN